MNKQVNTLNTKNEQDKVIFTTFGLLLGITMLSGSALSALSASASEDTRSANLSVSVASACTMTANNSNDRTATLTPGSPTSDIQGVTMNTICNDLSGYSVYAIGYTNGTNGTTYLDASFDNGTSNDIQTGVATSGSTSNWAMKVTSVAGSYAPAIVNDYGNYSVVPSVMTKVATYNGATDGSTGSSLQAWYQVYSSIYQAAGSYEGQVKYVMVHPATAATPSA